jgi:hypothetical protein
MFQDCIIGIYLLELMAYAMEIDLDYHADKYLPSNEVLLSLKLNMIKSDLSIATLVIDERR